MSMPHKPGLTLTRKPGEAVIITVAGVEVEVTVSKVGPGRTALSFAAPREVTIDRKEVTERKRAERTTTAA